MASTAALQLHPRLQPATVPPGSGRPPRPQLRVLEGGRAGAAQARRRTYLRRRLVAAVVAVALVAALYLLAGSALAGTAGGGTPSAAAGATSPATHVVQPGDTLWTIAAAAAPDVDVRITVDRIAELNGRGPLVVGQRLLLP
jgi:nucleoid-associated protein YgaU